MPVLTMRSPPVDELTQDQTRGNSNCQSDPDFKSPLCNGVRQHPVDSKSRGIEASCRML